MDEQFDINNPTNLSVNPLIYPSITCDNCGNQYYKQVVIFKRIPGVVTGNGAEPTILPIPVHICDKCGTLMEEYRRDFEDSNSEELTDNTQKSSIII